MPIILCWQMVEVSASDQDAFWYSLGWIMLRSVPITVA